MGKRRNPINEAIERLTQIYDAELEDYVEADMVRTLIIKLKDLSFQYERIDKDFPKRRMGRHSSAAVRKRERTADFRCYELVEKIRARDKVSLDRACEEAAIKSRKGFDTVKKAYRRAKKLRRAPSTHYPV